MLRHTTGTCAPVKHLRHPRFVPQVRNQRVTFPLRRTKHSCQENCNYLARSIAEGLNRGLQLGKL